jgi:hypothetical protein
MKQLSMFGIIGGAALLIALLASMVAKECAALA